MAGLRSARRLSPNISPVKSTKKRRRRPASRARPGSTATVASGGRSGGCPAPILPIGDGHLAARRHRRLRPPIGEDVVVDLGVARDLEQLDASLVPNRRGARSTGSGGARSAGRRPGSPRRSARAGSARSPGARCRRRPRSAGFRDCGAAARAIRPGRSASAGRPTRRRPAARRRRCGGRSARTDRSRSCRRARHARGSRAETGVVSTSTIVISPGRKVIRTAPVVDSESMRPWTVIALLPGAGRSSQKARKIGNSSPLASAGLRVSARATTPKFCPRARARKKVAPWTMAKSDRSGRCRKSE